MGAAVHDGWGTGHLPSGHTPDFEAVAMVPVSLLHVVW